MKPENTNELFVEILDVLTLNKHDLNMNTLEIVS